MARETFDRELRRLQDDMLDLGGMTERALHEAIAALRARDLEHAQRIMADDAAINQRRFALEADCLLLIATQQPMASDLRIVAAVLDITSNLERMADHAKGIAKITIMLGTERLIKPLVDIPIMAQKAAQMLHEALESFVRRDAEGARQLVERDDEIDAYYDQIYRELLSYMLADPRTINQATLLLWIAHNIERYADRVTNICERVVFTVTGEMKELDLRGPSEPTPA
ncbi:MAG: phosphate signaling complex protein PhoU [Anaerolineae bacterium]|nr:phosphate signaling complex protein PhoU [Anaerolineae bacterium]